MIEVYCSFFGSNDINIYMIIIMRVITLNLISTYLTYSINGIAVDSNQIKSLSTTPI
jgi:hypothetical protein